MAQKVLAKRLMMGESRSSTLGADKGVRPGCDDHNVGSVHGSRADSNDDRDILRHGGINTSFKCVYAATTLGSHICVSIYRGNVKLLTAVVPVISSTGDALRAYHAS